MSKGSEQASWRWAEGAERVCRICGEPIRRLANLGEVRTLMVAGKPVRELRCMACMPGRAA